MRSGEIQTRRESVRRVRTAGGVRGLLRPRGDGRSANALLSLGGTGTSHTAVTRLEAAPGSESARVADGLARDWIGTDGDGAAEASRTPACRRESPRHSPLRRRDRRNPTTAQSAGLVPTAAVVATRRAATPQAVPPMINTRSRVDGCALDWIRARSTDRTGGSASTLRILAIGATCLFLCACGGGGGGGGSDAPVTPPAPAPTELAWDNGNWDQQEWK